MAFFWRRVAFGVFGWRRSGSRFGRLLLLGGVGAALLRGGLGWFVLVLFVWCFRLGGGLLRCCFWFLGFSLGGGFPLVALLSLSLA